MSLFLPGVEWPRFSQPFALEVTHEPVQARHRRIHRKLLVGLRRVRQCGSCRGFSATRNRVLRCGPRVWTHGSDHGLCHRAHFRLPSESRHFDRTDSGPSFPRQELPHYIIAQVTGGIAGAAVLYVIARGKAGFDLSAGFASNGYAEHSPGGYSLMACLVTEIVLTFFFLVIIMGATDRHAPSRFAPIAIGLGLTLINLVGIPVSNCSVNPARSTGPAVFVGGWAIAQLWLFWVAPIIGGALGGVVYSGIFDSGTDR